MIPLFALAAMVTSFAPAIDMPAVINRFAADRDSLERAYPVAASQVRADRFRKFYNEELGTLGRIDYGQLDQDGKVDYVLLEEMLRHELRTLDAAVEYKRQMAPLLPFANTILDLELARRRMEPIDSPATATKLNELSKTIADAKKRLEGELEHGDLAVTNGVDKAPANAKIVVSRSSANRALQTLGEVRRSFEHWYGFYNGYDPSFGWWNEAPHKAVLAALDDYVNFVRERIVAIKADDKTTIIGFPIGREALLADLEFERIPYTPEELIAIADKQYDWCLAEMKKASRELGYGDDWHKALEHVKQQYVEPGKQPALIRELALEAIDFVEKRDLVTIPPLAKETWRMEMMSPEAQLQNPFFLGGETIQVSFPTNTMAHEAKLMSLRGNNRYFARATVHHELIPGHHLQGFMADRYNPHRQNFYTPFYVEGWALYWEMLLWNLGFAQTPEQKIGMLFWRMHRCARITFSLSFHLGKMTPQQCVDMLVDKVGHERENALAEVRRSFAGNYSPLYQAAYMLGGLQLMSLKHDLVDSGKMTIKQFHDAVLHTGPIPIDLVRVTLTGAPLEKDKQATWRFAPTN
ncbi:DUF885 family protein [Fimbriimonas ginsengisoli]|uniref:X-Pro dipeptidyl-peptidase n=1 Tax=Fimbriimonas ginsengisoli Gsoil 348 TaxID=661478 RepID=A0A068NNB7_FIMGI|nr:DUF885 family protein [Fimbriimonas ginsengisoli]AIE84897.1 X-Pro dipeptidyl-peptidase [Fimbriimonas ginsengisoli Gsoil 348]